MSPLLGKGEPNGPSSLAADPHGDLDVVELERLGQRAALRQSCRGAVLERRADAQAEVVLQRLSIAEHNPLAGVYAPLAGGLDDLRGTAIAHLLHVDIVGAPAAPREC